MPPAASVLIRSLLPALAALRIASASPTTLVEDDFGAADDSLWHFRTAAFTAGVLSPGLEAKIPGRNFGTGQLRVDAPASALRFVPRHGVKAHRSCFLGYRSDFRMDGAYARHVDVEILGQVSNPAAQDSLGGLYVLVRYENEAGFGSMARTLSDIRSPGTVSLDTAALAPVDETEWLSYPPLSAERCARIRSRITGVGLIYISQSTADFRSQALLVGGIRARGELSFPSLPGEPEAAEIMAGDSVVLTWAFPPALQARFDWYRNERAVPDARGPRYVFRTGPDDARVHVFRAEVRLPNGDRIATRQMRVRVLRPAAPRIGSQSGDTTVPLGGNAIFHVVASGLKPLSYQWNKDGKPISGATGPDYTFVPSAMTEGGRYQCEIRDRQGRSSLSRPMALIVKPGPESETGLPQGLSLGPKVGFNVSDFFRDPTGPAPSEFRVNFLQAGLGAAWQWSPAWALLGDVLFARKGVTYDYADHTSIYNLDYLELPLLLRMRLGNWIPRFPVSLLAGGYGAMLVSTALEEDWDGWKGNGSLDGFETFDYGAVAGLSWQFGMFSVDSRYALGLAPLKAGAFDRAPLNGVFSVMVGLTLFTALDGPR